MRPEPPPTDAYTDLRAALQRVAEYYGLKEVTIRGPASLPSGCASFTIVYDRDHSQVVDVK